MGLPPGSLSFLSLEIHYFLLYTVNSLIQYRRFSLFTDLEVAVLTILGLGDKTDDV
jgi:hypothetical protein